MFDMFDIADLSGKNRVPAAVGIGQTLQRLATQTGRRKPRLHRPTVASSSRAVVSATRPSLLYWSIQRSSASTIITMIASVVRNSSTLPCGP